MNIGAWPEKVLGVKKDIITNFLVSFKLKELEISTALNVKSSRLKNKQDPPMMAEQGEHPPRRTSLSDNILIFIQN